MRLLTRIASMETLSILGINCLKETKVYLFIIYHLWLLFVINTNSNVIHNRDVIVL